MSTFFEGVSSVSRVATAFVEGSFPTESESMM
jgi:hypothetical protein